MLQSILKTSKRIAGRVPGVNWLRREFAGLKVPLDWADRRAALPAPDRARLAREYAGSVLAAQPDDFVLYRIIGNDLHPRHARGQSRDNLRFILENEPPLPGCEKRFIVNRIVDPGEEGRIIDLLERAGLKYLRIPFSRDEYRAMTWDIAGVPVEYAPHGRKFRRLNEAQQGRVLMRIYRHKNNYVMNNNGARNAALREGRVLAKWVLPWDGNCFVTGSGWRELTAAVREHPEIPYYIVPMARIVDNARLLDPAYRPAAAEEPQIVFRRDAGLEFDPDYFYGRRPKVELFWRLGIPGSWDEWPVEPWDLPCPDFAAEAGCFAYAGWVARLFSGNTRLESSGNATTRRSARVQAICAMLDALDVDERGPERGTAALTGVLKARVSDETAAGLRESLREAAAEALGRGPFSVVDKTSLPPSKDPRDYWHPAPYYWPNPVPIPGLPYIKRDGRRVPGTRLYEPLSEQYDRSRLQRLFDDTFVSALAFRESGDRAFAEHGARLIRRWFLDPATAMNPHLEYAQVRRGHNRNRGGGRGIIEFKDMYYFLDAVRIIEASGALTETERGAFRDWLGRYLEWLVESPQGRSERSMQNNHGTCYDLQVASIAGFLGEAALLRRSFIDSRFRIIEQFDETGRQPHEMKRPITAHYCCFNLQSWIHLAEVGEAAGEDLWSFEGPRGQSLEKAMSWLLSHMGKPWPYAQIEPFDAERFFPIYYACRARFGEPPGVEASLAPPAIDIKPLFYPHDGIRPFWQLR